MEKKGIRIRRTAKEMMDAGLVMFISGIGPRIYAVCEGPEFERVHAHDAIDALEKYARKHNGFSGRFFVTVS